MTGTDRRLVLLRHGETEWARLGRHTSTTDVPLTERGAEQARAAGALVSSLELRDPLVVSSPRQRAHVTATLAGLVGVQQWDALAEWDYGELEGLTTPEIRRQIPHWTVWTHPCPGGETQDMVSSRADMVLGTCEATLADRDVLLVGHGHFSRALIARWIELPVSEGRRVTLAPAGLTVLSYEHGFRTIVTHNVTPEVGTE
ncbi:acid phosphatase [Rhodococcus spongiicola]|uniref:Acid phosphatase n=1 Tax=Rhodococcus spongiicola TaxID=2487352 RepID=A0A3S3CSJ3_9NOCA|nr:acid phosphatase [Rhodococcus spongiicola]RVW04606.1 acid phosphatase [Rhodococcus spongiicola]